MTLEHVEHLWVLLLHLQLVGLLDFADEEFGIALGVAVMEATILDGKLNREGGIHPAE